MTYPWNTLKIEPTDDRKIIKKAYAQLLRKYRPDEHPEQFQTINQAYQVALNLAAEKPEKIDPEMVEPLDQRDSLQPLDDQYEVVIEGSQLQAETPIDYSQPVYKSTDVAHSQASELALCNNMLEQFHQMAFAEYKDKKQVENWDFLQRYHDLEDFQLRESFSNEIFKRIVEYNHFQNHENGGLLIDQAIARVIAACLDWEANWQALEKRFPTNYMQHVFGLLESVSTSNRSAPIFTRVFAVNLEIALINVGLLVSGLHEQVWSRELLVLLLFVASSTLASLTKLNLPLVQYAFDIRLFDRFINQPSRQQKLIRMATFHITMIPVYSMLSEDYRLSPWSEISLSVVVVVNLFCWFKQKQLFHDWIAGTLLLK